MLRKLLFCILCAPGTAWSKVCEPLLTPLPKQAHLSLERDISERRLNTLLHKLEDWGIQLQSEPQAGKDLVVSAANDRYWSRISRIDGVTRVGVKTASSRFLVWRYGRKAGTREIDGRLTNFENKLWAQIEEPVRGLPPRDLESLRRIARERGFWIVISGHRPDEKSVKKLEILYGARLLFSQDLPPDSTVVTVPGVVLHLSPNSQDLMIRGDVNLAMGLGRFYAKLNKVTEYFWITGVDRELMASSQTGRQLFNGELETLRRTAANLSRKFIFDNAGNEPQLRESVKSFLSQFFTVAKKRFPKGLFVKWAYDYATRENGSLITADTSIDELAGNYVDHLIESRKILAENGGRMNSQNMLEWIADSESSKVMITYSLLARPDDVLVQQKLNIRKMPSGSLCEFRVDVLYGHALNSSFRYGNDYLPEQAEGAKKFIQNFIDRLPERERYMSGGFDVVELTDGKFKIIESNPGTDSSFLDPGTYPVSGNLAISALLGHSTPVILKMEEFYGWPVHRQASYLARATVEPKEIESIDDISRDEILTWYRERIAHGVQNRDTAKSRLAAFRDLLKASGLWKDAATRAVYKGLADYFKRRFE